MKKHLSFTQTLLCGLALVGLADGADKFVLKPHWEAGKNYEMKSETQMDMTLPAAGAGGQKMNMTQTMSVGVTAEAGTGNKLAEMKFTGIKAQMNMMGQSMEYDSSDPSKSNPLLGKSLGALVNKGLTLVYDKDDNYVEVRGADKLLAGGAMGQAMGEKQMTDMFRKSIDMNLPKQAVGPGDTWNASDTMELGPAGSLQISLDGKFDSIVDVEGRKHAKLILDGKFSTPAGGANAVMSIGEGSKVHGEILFDLERKLPSVTTMEAEMTISAAGQQMPMKQKSVTTLTSK